MHPKALPDSFLATPIAHRALHDVTQGRPENSRAAIRAAIAAGYGIEIDVQLSKDGEAMVFHDYALTRLTGAAGPIQQKTAAELSALSLLGGDEGIPTLPQVLGLVAGQVPVLIEIKDQDGQMGEGIGALEAAVARALKSYPGDVAVMSFNPHSVAEMARLLPDVPRGLTTCGYRPDDWPTLRAEVRDTLRRIPDFERVGACFVSHNHQSLTAPAVQALHDKGIAILTWTIRSPEEEAAARKVADNITFEGYAA
ncbi:glycerophosphodiester phosphodiesterase family protein [Tropicibacter naphthalenivorans]|uniref:Glycerophosphoryl diester phosphodiesterase n=1 Tax=Tropicibacter naphthalenivorans TaxID=441103 RepID=A0A0P1GA81_9RHOB|nr:glycerophosphodiester phosphodiesterase family protein [Tropicibacter naphthalenivorans]CUH78420.1 Glycerophosphoryl diester phosphodiesterase [Tropicibacter naphthalenivorans]SMC80305.1 Glycerophosphoryl diester phosphodiesterase [Tropicibacter naphthalenivorans]